MRKALIISGGALACIAVAVVAVTATGETPLEHAPEFIAVETGEGGAVALSRTEITVAQWRECVDAGACPDLPLSSRTAGDHAMTGVSYYDSLAYIEWYNQRTGARARLPTREEWMSAAADHAPKPRKKLFSDPRLAWAADYDTESERKPTYTFPVGNYGDNASGFTDFRGNVWEWTASCSAEGSDDGCLSGRIAMGEHQAELSSLVRDPAKAGCGGGQPPALLGFRIAI